MNRKTGIRSGLFVAVMLVLIFLTDGARLRADQARSAAAMTRNLPSHQALEAMLTAHSAILGATEPITVTLSMPGTAISGTVVINAEAPGRVAATRAELFLDDTPRSRSTLNPFSWDWVTMLSANGEHNLRIEAYDEMGDLVASGEITVTVDNAVTPQRWMPAGLSQSQVRDVETSPTLPGVAYAVDEASTHKTTDWGCFWGAMRQGLPTYSSLHCLATDPSEPDSLFLGTALGVYESQDGGETWQSLTLPHYITDLAVGGANGQWLYAIANYNTIYRSSDGGDSWSNVLENVGSLLVVAVDPVDGQTAYVGSGSPWDEAAVFKTTDGGSNWDSVPIVDTGEASSMAKIHLLDRQTLYLGISWGPGGLFKSTNAGLSWQQVLNHGISTLVQAPSEPETIYAEEQWGNLLFLSQDGGQQWEPVREGLPAGTSMRKLAVDSANPAIVYAASSDHGLWSTVYTAHNPEPLVTGIQPPAAYNDRATVLTMTGSDFSPTPDVMLDDTPLPYVTFVSSTTITATVPAGLPAGQYDLVVINPSGFRSYLPDCFTLLTPTSVEIIAPGDGAVISGIATVRATTGNGNGIERIELYLDDELHAAIVSGPYEWIWDSSLAEAGPHQIQARAYDLIGKTVASNTVHVIVDNPETEGIWSRSILANETVTQLEAGPPPGVLWSLANNVLYRSVDHGATWNRADAGISSEVRFIASDSNSASDSPVYAATWNQIFVSQDTGLTWTPDATFSSDVIYLDLVAGTPYAATYGYQVYQRLPTGEWVAVGNPLSEHVYDMGLHNGTLYLGTWGGLYQLAGTLWQPVTISNYPLTYYEPSAWFEPRLKPRSQPQAQTIAATIGVYSILSIDDAIYLGTSGGRAVYRSIDGQAWTACDVGLTSNAVNRITASSNGWLFAATTDGVFVSKDRGDRWQALDAGLPHSLTGYNQLLDNVSATSLVVSRNKSGQQELKAAFNQKGVWHLQVNDDMLLGNLPSQSPPKAVLIVGPVDPPDHTATQSFIAWSDRLASVMGSHGMEVVKVYWPDSTWENVRAALSGASIVVYKGHGFGLGEVPEDPTEMVGGCNGFCLVAPNDPAGARLGTQDMLITTSQLADNAIAFLFCCSCAGSSAGDTVPVSEALARRRIEAYAFTLLRMGAKGYFSGVAEESILMDFFENPHMTLGDLYMSFGGNPQHTYSHVLWPEYSVWFDGNEQQGWGRAFVGDPNLTRAQVLGKTIYLPLVVHHH